MRFVLPLTICAGLALAGGAAAQQRAAQPPQPPLMECGVHGDVEIICGTRSPEDLELTPDGKYLVVSQFTAPARGGGLVLLDLAAKTFTKLAVAAEPLPDWGDSACPGAIGEMLSPHGISLLKRSNGKVQLFVVNHGGRESIEMFELQPAAGSWTLAWHGCVVSKQAFNDVAALPDGGFYATHPTALQTPGMDLFTGQPSGWVASWMPGKGEVELPGTRAGYPNGVLAAAGGRYLYFNAWTAKEVHKYDLKQNKEVGMVKLDFMPDNITWTKKGRMLAAGVKGARGECPAGSGTPCGQTFGIAEIDGAKMTSKPVFDSQGKGALITGVSSALQVGNSVYIGAFNGERLVKFGWKE
jgi:hypothetical protein